MSAASPFIIEKALLSSNRTGIGRPPVSFDISKVITDIQIFEHLSKPYTTATIQFVDTADTISNIDLQGGEYFDLTIRSTSGSGVKKASKQYYITKIDKAIRAGENAEAVVFSCIDRINMRSHLQNVNEMIEGTPLQMVQHISNQYLNTDIVHNQEKYQQHYRLIVPNLTPLDTIDWVSQQAVTTIGMPSFVYGIWTDDKLRYTDLEDLLTYPALNPSKPLVYGFARDNANVPVDGDPVTYKILSYQYADNHDIFNIIDQGYLSAHHYYYDTMQNREYDVEFRASRDLFNPMVEKSLFARDQRRMPMAPEMSFDGFYLEEFESRNTFKMGSSSPWEDGYSNIGHRPNLGGYTNDVVNSATRAFMGKETMQWQVEAKHMGFIDNGAHAIGKKIRLLFGRADTDKGPNKDPGVDMKKSGDFLVMAIRHVFSKERYDVHMTGTKLGSLNSPGGR